MALSTPGSALRKGSDAMMDRLGLNPQVAAEVDDVAMMRLLVREGVGVLIECAELQGLAETCYGVTVERKLPNPLLRSLM